MPGPGPGHRERQDQREEAEQGQVHPPRSHRETVLILSLIHALRGGRGELRIHARTDQLFDVRGEELTRLRTVRADTGPPVMPYSSFRVSPDTEWPWFR